MVSSIQGSTYAEWSLSNSDFSTKNNTGDQTPSRHASETRSPAEDSYESHSVNDGNLLHGDTVSISTLAQNELLQKGQPISKSESTDGNEALTATARVAPMSGETPHYAKTVELPNGQEALQLGNIDSSKDYFHKQGQNDLGYLGTCGLTSCGDVANQFGVKVTENDVVHYAVDHGLCDTGSGTPSASGGTTMADQAGILDGLGIPSHLEVEDSLEGLGRKLEEGHGVIIEVNAGELWKNPAYYDSGSPNHAVTVTGVAVDPNTNKALGVWIDDSGSGQYARYVSADDSAIQNWKANGELSVVTDLEHV